MRTNVLRRAAVALLSAAALAVTAPAAGAATPAKPAGPKAVTATPARPGADGKLTAPAVLGSGQKLLPGQSLTSGESTLVMQGDGNLVMYLVGPTGHRGPAIWSTGTWGHQGAYAYMQVDGSLVIYLQGRTDSSAALWSTGTSGHWGAKLQLLNGWLVVYGNGAFWQTDTGPAGTTNNVLDPGSILDTTRGIRPGWWIESKSVWLVSQPDGNVVLYRKRDGAALWSTGTWGRRGSIAYISQETGAVFLIDSTTARQIWSTPAFGGARGAYAKVQDDGNFVIYRQGRTDPAGALWSTGTWGNS